MFKEIKDTERQTLYGNAYKALNTVSTPNERQSVIPGQVDT